MEHDIDARVSVFTQLAKPFTDRGRQRCVAFGIEWLFNQSQFYLDENRLIVHLVEAGRAFALLDRIAGLLDALSGCFDPLSGRNGA